MTVTTRENDGTSCESSRRHHCPCRARKLYLIRPLGVRLWLCNLCRQVYRNANCRLTPLRSWTGRDPESARYAA